MKDLEKINKHTQKSQKQCAKFVNILSKVSSGVSTKSVE